MLSNSFPPRLAPRRFHLSISFLLTTCSAMSSNVPVARTACVPPHHLRAVWRMPASPGRMPAAPAAQLDTHVGVQQQGTAKQGGSFTDSGERHGSIAALGIHGFRRAAWIRCLHPRLYSHPSPADAQVHVEKARAVRENVGLWQHMRAMVEDERERRGSGILRRVRLRHVSARCMHARGDRETSLPMCRGEFRHTKHHQRLGCS